MFLLETGEELFKGPLSIRVIFEKLTDLASPPRKDFLKVWLAV